MHITIVLIITHLHLRYRYCTRVVNVRIAVATLCVWYHLFPEAYPASLPNTLHKRFSRLGGWEALQRLLMTEIPSVQTPAKGAYARMVDGEASVSVWTSWLLHRLFQVCGTAVATERDTTSQMAGNIGAASPRAQREGVLCLLTDNPQTLRRKMRKRAGLQDGQEVMSVCINVLLRPTKMPSSSAAASAEEIRFPLGWNRLRGACTTEEYADPHNSYMDAMFKRGIGIPITLSVALSCLLREASDMFKLVDNVPKKDTDKDSSSSSGAGVFQHFDRSILDSIPTTMSRSQSKSPPYCHILWMCSGLPGHVIVGARFGRGDADLGEGATVDMHDKNIRFIDTFEPVQVSLSLSCCIRQN